MSSNDDNKSEKPVIRTIEIDNGGQPQAGANPNEEHITSGPGYFEKLFGFSLTGKDKTPNATTGKPTGDGKPVFKGDKTTSVPTVVPASTTTPALTDGTPKEVVGTDGAAKTDTAGGDTAGEKKDGEKGDDKGGEKKEDKRSSYVFREPEGPLKPHYSRPRAELIFDPEAPTVYMTPDAYKRMCLYVELAPKEVGWLGTISKRPNGDFLIEEVFLVEQEVTSVETELSVEGTEKLVLELLEDGDPGLEKSNKLHFWGHSHVRMGTSPSGTDESTMQRFAREGHEYYVRGIFNKLGRGTFDVYYYNLGYRLLDVPWAVMDPASGKILLDRQTHNRKWWQGGPVNNDRPSGYNYGGSYSPTGGYQSTWRERQEEQARQQDEKSGLNSFLNKSDDAAAAPAKKADDPLAISSELRAEVTAEYKAKVKERYFAPFKWFGGKKDDEDKGGNGDGNGADKGQGAGDGASPYTATSGPDDVASQVVDGDLIPTGKDVRPGNFSVKPGANQGVAGPQPEEKKGFFAWLGSLFESSPTPTPPYQPTPERPRKRCTPQNCNDPSHPWSTKYKGPKTNQDSRGPIVPDDRQ